MVWDDPAADRAGSGAEFFAGRVEEVSAPGRRPGATHPGGVSAGDLDPASGADRGDVDRRAGERADGVQADPRAGCGRRAISPGAAERRVGVLVFGRSEPTGAAAFLKAKPKTRKPPSASRRGTRKPMAVQTSNRGLRLRSAGPRRRRADSGTTGWPSPALRYCGEASASSGFLVPAGAVPAPPANRRRRTSQ